MAGQGRPEYGTPEIRDYGDLIELTQAGSLGTVEDGTGKQITITVDPIAQVTVQVLP
jgi:hypothetical protein